MAGIKLLQAPDYTEEERQALIDFVLALRKSLVQGLLGQLELPRSGTKPDLRERLQEALDQGHVTHEQLVEFLDSVAPWGKQHVFLYVGPPGDLKHWKDPDHVHRHLKDHRVGKYFNARLPLILPDKLALSSITYSGNVLRVAAVQKREYEERRHEYDERKESDTGKLITLKAYMQHVSRTIVTFEWDLNANTAMLQITQLQKDTLYEEVEREFFALVASWLDRKLFGVIDLRKVVRKLHELENDHVADTRSHGIHYLSLRGRRVSVHSPSPRDSVVGEPDIDNAMEIVRKNTPGHGGNFYWLAGTQPGPVSNPLVTDVHVVIVAAKSRVNFKTPNSEGVVRYVLHRVRALG